MRVPSRFLVLAPFAAVLLAPSMASAQWISKWGNPVIAFGSTPYSATSTGHGNYPGSDGFIPGYGYYPGQSADRYPWINGPGQPHTPPIPLPEPVGPTVPDGAALLRVYVPTEAELWVSDRATIQRGNVRVFVTPPLVAGGLSTYEIRARWLDQGRVRERTLQVKVAPGDRVTVDFFGAAVDESVPALPMPRKVEP